MIFLAIPALLETILTVAAGTIAAKAASDVYDKVVGPKDSDKE